MKFTELDICGAYLIEINKIEDERGFFGRAWCKKEFDDHGLKSDICQINTSFSHKKGTLRGIHYQVPPAPESKFVRCTRGAIFDVIVDLRPESATFLKWTGAELSANNYRMLYVPERFGHGFITLTDECEMYYIATQFYTPAAERGLRWDDPAIGVKWPVPAKTISERDKLHPAFSDAAAKELMI